METLSTFLSSSPPRLSLRTANFSPQAKAYIFSPACHHKRLLSDSPSQKTCRTKSFHKNLQLSFSFLNDHRIVSPYPHLSLVSISPLAFPLSCLASEELPNKINLESVLISIDNFFTRYPFFVATVAFIWLIAIPLTEEYLQKYKFISALNAFKKLQDDPTAELLDIRESRSLAFLPSPKLKLLNKSVVQVEFREGDEDVFVRSVLENFGDPKNTVLCVVDNFDGNSMKVAELLVKNGFKEAYAIRGGFLGQRGWTEIQEALLPPSVHVYPNKGRKKQKDSNGPMKRSREKDNEASTTSEETTHQAFISRKEYDQRPLSPYPNYPDMKPPSSPTPSKPH